MDFSPRHVETLQLSPSHFHAASPFHDDLRSLRRGISRSPSKNARMQRSSPSSPSKHTLLGQQYSTTPQPSPLGRSPYDASAQRKIRSSLTRATPIKSSLYSPRPDMPPSHTTRRPLSVASGNSSSQSSQETLDGQENQATTPEDTQRDGGIFTVSRPKPSPSPFRISSGRPRSITEREFLRERAPAKSSPLKRSDGLMNLDQPSFGSPSAKRRSLHAPTFEIAKDDEMKTDFAPQSDEDSDPDFASFRANITSRPPPTTRKGSGPTRISERSNASRNRRSLEPDFTTPGPKRTSSKNKSRASLDGGLPFRTEVVETGSPSMAEQRLQFAKSTRHQPHPLSRTMTPASPLQPSFGLEHSAAPSFPDTPDARPAFSKSLPIGALRPRPRHSLAQTSEQASATEFEFATPKPFDNARPDPAAFRSTGLISKRHRDPDDMPPPPGGYHAMPDTPCKRMPPSLVDQASPTSITSIAKPRFGQPVLFATPAKPSNKSFLKPGTGFGKAAPTFSTEGEQVSLNRSASFISADGSDSGRSPNESHGQGESHSSADELPPTPTKQIFGFSSIKSGVKNSSLRSSLFGRRTSVGPNTFSVPESSEQETREQDSTRRLCKFSGPEINSLSAHGSTFGSLDRKPVHPLAHEASVPPATGAYGNLRRTSFKEPSPSSQRSLRPPTFTEQVPAHAKTRINTVAQSLYLPTNGSSSSPKTPADFGVPDPSQLSISPKFRGAQTPSWRGSLRSSCSKPPETPSSHQQHAEPLALPATLTTPSHGGATSQDFDPVLAERFKKVIKLGQGQFSDVFKVHQAQQRLPPSSYLSPSAGRGASSRTVSTSLPDAIFVVKKTKAPLYGSRVRERTIREAQIMQTLGRNENIVTLIDSWEARSHLYLMTEYCEEGTLDGFLLRTGRDGRLDDFRIWKILLEVGAGLKHIHGSGFLHLDLKPENVFIDFSGTLKIGDFGLACEWPAPRTVEGEGDRRYIGPDLLLGNFDKPADIFAFGMMMYEIAGNFVPPDNGTNWHKLRSGDFSGLPSLTSDSSTSLSHITSGNFGHSDSYASPPFSPNTVYSSKPELYPIDNGEDTRMTSTESLTTPRVAKTQKRNESSAMEITEPPAFMHDMHHPASLDNVVHWMMLPLPQDRPIIDQVLDVSGCRWVAERRRAGAVVWEGPFGPSHGVSMRSDAPQEVKDERRMSGIAQDPQASQGTFFDDADAEMMDA